MKTSSPKNQQSSDQKNTKSLKRLIEDLRLRQKQGLEEINWTIIDLEKTTTSCDIYFSVDFFHIHEYAYPENYIKNSLTPALNSETLSENIQHRFALHYLFFQLEFGKLVLLPPHLIELKNHLKKEYGKALFNGQIDNINTIRDSLFTEDEKNLITKAGDEYKGGQLTKETNRKITELIFGKLRDVLFILSDFSTTGLKVINKIFKNQRILFRLDDIENYDDIITKSINSDNTDIFDYISKLRPKKYYQNILDSNTVKIVKGLNESFIDKGENRIIYLLSDTDIFMKLFHPKWYASLDKSVEAEGEPKKQQQKELAVKVQNLLPIEPPNSLHRTTNIFLEYRSALINQSEKDCRDYAMIEFLKERMKTFLDFQTYDSYLAECYKKCNDNNCVSCPIESDCEKIKKEITNWNTIFSNRLDMALLEKYALEENGINNSKKFEEAIKKIVDYLNKKDKDFEKTLSAKRNQLEQDSFDTITALSRQIAELSSETHEELVYRIKPTRRIGFEIKFNNPQISSILKESIVYLDTLDIEKSNINIEKEREIALKIFDLTRDETVGFERYLLLAILNYNFNQPDIACLVLSDLISNETISNREEFLLVYLLSFHQNAIKNKNFKMYDEAKQKCIEFKKSYPNDSRFENMYGETLARGKDAKMPEEETYENIINIFTNAYEIEKRSNDNSSFKTQILNNTVYVIYLKEYSKKNKTKIDKTLLLKAKSYLEEMETLLPINKWDANFYDTKGVLYYLLSTIFDDRSEDYMQESYNCLKKAYNLAKKHRFFEYEIKSICDHLQLLGASEKFSTI